MLDYNLTQRARQIIIRLLELSQNSKENFEARTVNPSAEGSITRFGASRFWRYRTEALIILLAEERGFQFMWRMN